MPAVSPQELGESLKGSFAIEGFTVLRYVAERVGGADLYEDLDMIADPDDPRDLFGMLQRAV